ncbi:hypothetical protein MANES_03G065680v8 [Manihot esculenta]|uniref:Uncharacterized protein n=1 Tax=Manihot esculenta TaxID=3983 RepID=A0ACB7HZI6_MANES|nr:hypothetical protein MANES_03G065680v8 [Manihot esculenta]
MMFKKKIIEKEKVRKTMALKLEKLTDGKKKSIALNIDTSESSNLSSYEEEMAMLVRKFRRAFRKGGSKCKRFVKKYGPKDDSQKDPKEIICYECNKPGHIRPNCPKNKKKKKEDKGKKAMVAVCDAIDESSSDDSNEKNEGNICCMALEKETAEPSKDEKIQVIESEPPNIEELELAFAKVYDKYKTYKRKCASLKLENVSLRSENISLNIVLKENEFYKTQMILFKDLKKELEISKQNCEKLSEKNKVLERKTESLTKDLTKFTKGKQSLELLFGSQRMSGEKSGIGYNGFAN